MNTSADNIQPFNGRGLFTDNLSHIPFSKFPVTGLSLVARFFCPAK